MTGSKQVRAAIFAVLLTTGIAHAVQSTVSQKGKIFAPDEITQAPGGTVHIENDDNIPHNVQVRSPDGESKNLGLQMPGDHADIAVDKGGDYIIYCGIHPKMRLVVHAR